MTKKQIREGIGLTALNIFFIVLCFVTLIPILYALTVSLSGQNSLLSSDFSFIPKDFTLDNYKEVIFGEDILTWFKNTVFLAVVTVSLSLLIAVPAAYCFSRRRFPGRKTILKCLVLLNSFPAILSMFAIYRLLRPMGLVNHRVGLILVYTGTMAVFSLWNTKGYFDTIPTEIEEAAKIDGAGLFQRILHIDLPALTPMIVLQLIMSAGGLMNVGFEKVFLLQTDLNKATSDVIAVYVYEQGIQRAKYSYGTAIGLFNTAINIVLLVIVNKIAKKAADVSFV